MPAAGPVCARPGWTNHSAASPGRLTPGGAPPSGQSSLYRISAATASRGAPTGPAGATGHSPGTLSGQDQDAVPALLGCCGREPHPAGRTSHLEGYRTPSLASCVDTADM